MKRTMTERIKRNLTEPRTMTAISIRLPERVIEDLKEVAPTLGFSGYQSLIRAYISQGLRTDLVRLERERMATQIRVALEQEGLSQEAIERAVAKALQTQGFDKTEQPRTAPVVISDDPSLTLIERNRDRRGVVVEEVVLGRAG